MTETSRGADRAGRRVKRFLTPSKKYEIWLQLMRQEVTIAEAAADHGVDVGPGTQQLEYLLLEELAVSEHEAEEIGPGVEPLELVVGHEALGPTVTGEPVK